MEFWTSVRVMVRRWYVVVPCLILTGAMGMYLVNHVKPTYQASGSVLLSGNGQAAHVETASTVPGVNPYANMDQSQLAFLVSQSAGSSSFADQMTAAGATGNFSVTAIPAEPAMSLTVTASTPEQALSSYHELLALLNEQITLKQRAVGAPSNTLVGVQAWTSPSSALPVNAAKVKALILVLVIGLLLTLGLTFLVDAALTHRVAWSRSRRGADDGRDDRGDDFDDLDDLLALSAQDEDEPRLGPVAVPAHVDEDEGELNEEDRQYGAELAGEATVRRASRYDIVLPLLAERSSHANSSPDRPRDREGLPPWVPPEERSRAAGS